MMHRDKSLNCWEVGRSRSWGRLMNSSRSFSVGFWWSETLRRRCNAGAFTEKRSASAAWTHGTFFRRNILRSVMIVELVFLGFLVSSCGDVKTEPDTIHTEPGTVEIQTKAVDVEPKAFNAEVTTVVEANAFHVEVNKEAFSISNPSLAIATSVNFAPETFKIVVAENAFKVTPVFKLMIAKEAFCVQPGAF